MSINPLAHNGVTASDAEKLLLSHKPQAGLFLVRRDHILGVCAQRQAEMHQSVHS